MTHSNQHLGHHKHYSKNQCKYSDDFGLTSDTIDNGFGKCDVSARNQSTPLTFQPGVLCLVSNCYWLRFLKSVYTIEKRLRLCVECVNWSLFKIYSCLYFLISNLRPDGQMDAKPDWSTRRLYVELFIVYLKKWFIGRYTLILDVTFKV